MIDALHSRVGIPLKHRRNFFEAWAAGLIE